MKTYIKKISAAALSATIVMASLCGCGGGEKSSTADFDLSSYPIKTKETLTYWMDMPSNISTVYSNFGETEFAKELEKETGVKIKYVHPSAGQASQAFSLMIAAGDMTDMIQTNWSTALGGPATAIADNVIIPLNDLIDEYGPNLKKYIESNPKIAQDFRTDDGQYYVFPFIRGDEKLWASMGPVIRRDWLEKVNMEIPETLDEFETALRAFKNELHAKAPLTMLNYNTYLLLDLCQASMNFYVDNGKIKYGPYEPEYKEALTRLNRWYEEGLLDNNYLSADITVLDANMLNGVSGATYASGGSGVGKWIGTAKSRGEKFDVVGIPFLLTEKGKEPKFGQLGSAYAPYGSAAISSTCKHPELAAKFLDYGFSEEGHNLFNFGIEGISYNMIDDYATYTDEIMKNPDGLTVSQALGKYVRAGSCGPFVQDKMYIEQYYVEPQQKESLDNWTKYILSVKESKLPTLTYSAEESSEYANLMSEINKHVEENTAVFISGIKPLDKYEKYYEELTKLKVERAIEIVQKAYDRYLER